MARERLPDGERTAAQHERKLPGYSLEHNSGLHISYSERLLPHFFSYVLRYPLGMLYSCAQFTFLHKFLFILCKLILPYYIYYIYAYKSYLDEVLWLVTAALVASSDYSSLSGYLSNVILPPHPHLYPFTNSPKKCTTTLLKKHSAKTASPHLDIPNEFETPL